MSFLVFIKNWLVYISHPVLYLRENRLKGLAMGNMNSFDHHDRYPPAMSIMLGPLLLFFHLSFPSVVFSQLLEKRIINIRWEMANNLSCNKFQNNVWFQKISIPALRRVTENSKVKGGLTWNTIWYKAAVQIKKIYHWISMDIFWDNKKKD